MSLRKMGSGQVIPDDNAPIAKTANSAGESEQRLREAAEEDAQDRPETTGRERFSFLHKLVGC